MNSEQVDVRRLRVLAAVSLGVASASVGFMGGWFASRLVPPENQSVAAVAERKQPVPTANPSQSPKVQGNRPDVAAAPASNTGNVGGTQQSTSTHAKDRPAPENAEQQGKEDKNPPDAAAAPAKPRVEETYGGATIINAGSAEKQAATREASVPSQPVARAPASEANVEPASDAPNQDASRERSADQDALERCARKYSSFRASDGTYQPYDGGPRKLCSLLR